MLMFFLTSVALLAGTALASALLVRFAAPRIAGFKPSLEEAYSAASYGYLLTAWITCGIYFAMLLGLGALLAVTGLSASPAFTVTAAETDFFAGASAFVIAVTLVIAVPLGFAAQVRSTAKNFHASDGAPLSAATARKLCLVQLVPGLAPILVALVGSAVVASPLWESGLRLAG